MADLSPMSVYTCHEPGCGAVAHAQIECNNVVHGRYCHAHKTFARSRHEAWCGCGRPVGTPAQCTCPPNVPLSYTAAGFSLPCPVHDSRAQLATKGGGE